MSSEFVQVNDGALEGKKKATQRKRKKQQMLKQATFFHISSGQK